MYVQCGQSASRFQARPGHGKGACHLRGWARELHRAAGSRRVQTVPTVETCAIAWCVTVEVAVETLMRRFCGDRVSGELDGDLVRG
jgi:hypothetical protein